MTGQDCNAREYLTTTMFFSAVLPALTDPVLSAEACGRWDSNNFASTTKWITLKLGYDPALYFSPLSLRIRHGGREWEISLVSSRRVKFWELFAGLELRLIQSASSRAASLASRGLRKRPALVALSFLTIFVGEGCTTQTRSFRFYNNDPTARTFTTNSFYLFGFWGCP